MQRARAFFYVSLGVLALAGAFHLGAQTAQGQAGLLTIGSPGAGIDMGGQVWVFQTRGATSGIPGIPIGSLPQPKSGTPIHVSMGVGDPGAGLPPSLSTAQGWILYDDGDLFAWDGGGWFYKGNLIGAPVQATETSWGRIKADRR